LRLIYPQIQGKITCELTWLLFYKHGILIYSQIEKRTVKHNRYDILEVNFLASVPLRSIT
jgi:hypothetical protein